MSARERTLGVIPARYSSSRLPGKPLADICGQPMIQRVWARASRASRLDALVVATDDPRIQRAVEGFGGRAVMTRADHVSGSDRVFEAAELLSAGGHERIINIQGDEPLLDPAVIDALAAALDDPSVQAATAAAPLIEDTGPSTVKVALALSGDALYFSRSRIPSSGDALHHLGIYAYRRGALARFVERTPGPLERAERLEQLRFLEYGERVRVIRVPRAPLSVDTPEDLQQVRSILNAEVRRA